MLKSLTLCLLFLTALLNVNGQKPNNQTTPKELLLQIQQSKPDTNRIKLQLQLGKYYVDKPNENKKDLDSAYSFFNQAIKLSDDLHSAEWKNKALILTASCDGEAGNIQHAKTCFTQVIDYYHKNNNKQQEAESWNALGKLIPVDNKTNISYKLQ